MSQIVEVKVPDIGDFSDVPVIEVFVKPGDVDAWRAAIRPNTRALFAESLGNPSLILLDIPAVAEVAHAHGLPLIIDNTVPSPYLCNPLHWGADIVVHSTTKYINRSTLGTMTAALNLPKKCIGFNPYLCRNSSDSRSNRPS